MTNPRRLTFGTIIRSVLLVVALVGGNFLTPTTVHAAATYYVSTTDGNDSNAGTSSSAPWKTIEKVNTFLASSSHVAGDTILFKRGDTFTPATTTGIVMKKNGTSSSKITLGAYGSGAKPILNGFSTVTGWTSIGTNLWEAPAPTGASSESPLIINNILTPLGRYPKATATNGGYISFASGAGNNSITDTAIGSLPNLANGAEVVLRGRHWVHYRRKIDTHSGNTIGFSSTFPGGDQKITAGGQGIFFQNLPSSLLTQNGEWAYDAATSKIRMYYAGTPPTTKIGTVTSLVDVGSYDYITISNLDFEGAKVNGVTGTSAANITVDSSDFSFSGQYAINLNYQYNYTITNNTFTDSLNNAIYLNGSAYYGYRISDNTFTNTGIYAGTLALLSEANSNHAIQLKATLNEHSSDSSYRNWIERNTITNTGQVPIRFYGNDILIKNNFVDTFLTVLDDNGGIYTYNGGGTSVPKTLYNQRIEANIVGNGIGNKYGTSNGYTQANGIYLDNNSNHVDVIGNTTFNIADDATHHNSPQYVTMADNVFFNAGSATYNMTHWANDGTNTTNGGQDIKEINYNNNISFNQSTTAKTWEYGDLNAAWTADGYTGAGTIQARLQSIKSTTDASAMNNNIFYSGNTKDFTAGGNKCTSSCASFSGNLASWKTYSGFEAGSTQPTMPAANNVLFFYNPTMSAITATFTGTYTNVKDNVNYTNSITVPSFGSVILVKAAAVVDTTAPTVSLTAPASGTVSGTVSLAATATDAVGVASVSFYHGTTLISTDTTSPYAATWDTTALANGSYSLTAKASDAAGNVGTSTAVSVTVNNPDITAPTVALTAPTAGTTITSGSTTLSATASDTGTVSSGIASVAFYHGTTLIATDTTSPYSTTWTTSALANGSYVLKAVVTDGAGNATTSSTVTVTVNNPDTTAPTVSLTAPAANATITNGSSTLTATATDNIGVTSVSFYQGATLIGSDATSPYSVTWNTSALANGSYALTARASDAAGNIATSATVNVTVANPDITAPTVSLTTPTAGTVSGSVSLAANASDTVGVTSVAFYYGSTLIGSDSTSPYTATWNTTTVANGTYALTARASDAAGNVGTSTAVSVTVNNIVADTTAPTVTLTAPSAGTITGTTTLSATASDNVGVAKVDFYYGTTLIASDTTSSYGTTWNTTTIANGSYVLKAIAYDAAGNSTTSNTINVTVNNVASGTVTITTPVSGTTVSGTIAMTATTTATNVTKVDFYKDADTSPFATAVSSYTIFLNTTTLTSGTHTFRAVATTSTGSTVASSTITLTINNGGVVVPPTTGTPSAPTITSAKTGYSLATLAWTTPSSDGGSAITGYTITANPGNITSTKTSTSGSVSGLKPDTAYTFTVTAKNATGAGTPSAAVSGSTMSTFPISSSVQVKVSTTLTVRKSASSSSTKMGSVTGEVVGTVLQNGSGWTKVQFPAFGGYAAVTGWVSSNYLIKY